MFRASSSDVLTTRWVIRIRPPQSPRSAHGAGACSCPTGEAVRRADMASTDAQPEFNLRLDEYLLTLQILCPWN